MSIDQDVSEFVRQNIRSVWTLELLLLVRRRPDRRWTEADLVGDLRASQMIVAQGMAGLEQAGLVRRDDEGRWSYAPAAAPLDALCDALEAAYRERPVAVINLITRASPLQSLADAFKFRGEGK